MSFELEAHDRDEWNGSEYIDMGLTTKVYHHEGNNEDGENKHAVVLGDSVIVMTEE